MLARILGADQSNTRHFGELSGMVMQLDQSIVYLELQVPPKDNNTSTCVGLTDRSVDSACANVHVFDCYCQAFINTVIDVGGTGLFGKVCSYLGRVQEDHGGVLCLHMLLWLFHPYDSDKYDTPSIMAWGEANNGMYPLPFIGISRATHLHESFSTHTLGHSSWFQSIDPFLPGQLNESLLPSETNHCYKAFFRPDVTAPVFCVLIAKSYFLAPKEWTPWQHVAGSVQLAMATGNTTTKERIGLLGGLTTDYHSHSFVSMDSECIFNMVVAKYEKWVLHCHCALMLMCFNSKTPVYPEVIREYTCHACIAKHLTKWGPTINAVAEKYQLNEEQERAYQIVANHSCSESPEQLKMNMSGMAGTVKTQVL